MRKHRLAMALALAVSGVAAPASAQRWGSVEAGVFGQYNWFADSLRIKNALGGGGLLGLFVFPNIALEGDVAFARTRSEILNKDITWRPATGRVVWNAPLSERVKVLLGAGYMLGVYHGDTTYNEYEDAFVANAGLRFYLTPNWSLRAEVLADRFPSPGPGIARDREGYWNYQARAGLSFTYPAVEECVVVISPTTASLQTGQTQQFTATVRGARTGKAWGRTRITYSASDNNVDANTGLYTARTAGSATVTANARGRGCNATTTAENSARVTITAPPPPPPPQPAAPTVMSLELTPETATVLGGRTVQFTAVCRNASGATVACTPNFSASQGTINSNGLFTAPPNCAEVTVTAVAQENPNARDQSSVRVTCAVRDTVYFELGADSLNDDAKTALTNLARDVRANEAVRILIEGHADTIQPRGLGQARANTAAARRFNDRLSVRRAQSVLGFLNQQGIETTRFQIIPVGYGFCNPAVPHSASDFQIGPNGRPVGNRENRSAVVGQVVGDTTKSVWVCSGPARPVTPAGTGGGGARPSGGAARPSRPPTVERPEAARRP